MNPSSMHIKRFLLFYLTFFLFENAFGQIKTNVFFSNNNRSSIHVEMEKSISGLLTELNKASTNNRVPRLENLKISTGCKSRILELWDNTSISSPKSTINETLLLTQEKSTFGKGYQVRNIPLSLRGKDGTLGKETGVITLNSAGEIVAFYFAAAELDLTLVDWEVNDVIELGRRKQIQDVVEQFKTAYNRKDVQTIDDFFSDFALIIVGQVVKREANSDFDRFTSDKVTYKLADKQQYLQQIKRLFSRNEFIDVKFNEIKISKHRVIPGIYGVNLVQIWNSPSYKDEGNLFLMIDFRNEDNVKIHVRAWQPLGTEKLDLSNFDFDK